MPAVKDSPKFTGTAIDKVLIRTRVTVSISCFWRITDNRELSDLKQWTFIQLTTIQVITVSWLSCVGFLVLTGLNHASPGRRQVLWGLVCWQGLRPEGLPLHHRIFQPPEGFFRLVLMAAGRGSKRNSENIRGRLRPRLGMHTSLTLPLCFIGQSQVVRWIWIPEGEKDAMFWWRNWKVTLERMLRQGGVGVFATYIFI